jgi:TP901 family phage tail tape measure protein
MAEDIVQRLGFDAGGAIATINSLRDALGSLNTILATTGGELRSWNSAGANATKALNSLQKSVNQTTQTVTDMGSGTAAPVAQLGNNLKNLSDKHKNAANQMQQGNQRLTVSFRTLLRIMQFRYILSGVNALGQAFKEGVSSGAAFSRQLGMIQTVAGKGANIDQIESDLIRLSRLFARPLADVGAGYYLTLQNQVGNAAQSMQVLEQAMKVAVATGSSTTDAVDTLTVAINGFKLGADSAGDVSGKLFRAMEIGRFQFSEMKDTIGRVASIAKELGVSLEEVLGPVSTMTRQGVKFTTAVTQMRAILSQTLKPTEALKAIYAEKWGVETVEQAISKFGGLLPMLKALETETKGSNSELAKAFTNLRALTGAVSILGENYKEAVADTLKVKEANEALADSVYKMVAETPGQRFAQLVNQITVNFTKLGQSILPVLNSILGVVEKLTNSLSGLGVPGLFVFSGAVVAAVAPSIQLFGQWLWSINACKVALMGLGRAIPAIGALWLSWEAGKLLAPLIADLLNIPLKARTMHAALLEQEKKYSEEIDKENLKRVQSTIDTNKSIKDSTISALTELQKVHSKITDDIAQTNKNSVSTLKGELGNIISTQERLVKKLQQTAENGGQAMTDAMKDYTKSSQALADKEFGFRLDSMDNVHKAYAQMNRSQDQLNAAMGALGKATQPEEFAAIKEALSDAAAFASAASSSASQEQNNRGLLARTRGQELQIAQAMTQVDINRINAIRQAGIEAAKNLKLEEQKLTDMKTAVQDILKGFTQFTPTGKPKTEEDMTKDFQKAQIAWTNLINLMSKDKSVNLSAFLGVANLQKDLNAMGKKLPDMRTQVTFDYQQGLNKLMGAFKAIPKEVHIAFPELDKYSPFFDLMNRVAAKTDEMATLTPKVEAFNGEIKKLQGIVSTRIAEPFGNVLPNIAVLSKQTTNTNALAQAYNSMLLAVKSIGKVDPNNLQAFQQTLSQSQKALENFDLLAAKHPLQNSLLVDQNTVQAARDAIQQISQQFYGKIAGSPDLEAKAQLDKLTQQINLARTTFGAGIVIPVTLTGGTAENVASIAQNAPIINTNAQMTATAYALQASNAERVANAQERIKNAQISNPAINQARGGAMRFAGGGNVFKSHGTDTIPAMLSPGEFVVNARATRSFFSQLVAMNAGVKPVYRQDGGAVTNVGDINVSVNGSSSTRQTAREIATALRREVRRGTSKL